MAEHEPCIGATDDWYTPRDIFDALGLIFDLDPCSPGPAHWVPARETGSNITSPEERRLSDPPR